MFDIFFFINFFSSGTFNYDKGDGITFKGGKIYQKIQFPSYFPLELMICIAHFAANPSEYL